MVKIELEKTVLGKGMEESARPLSAKGGAGFCDLRLHDDEE